MLCFLLLNFINAECSPLLKYFFLGTIHILRQQDFTESYPLLLLRQQVYTWLYISRTLGPLLKSGLKILASGTKGGLEKFRGTCAYQLTYFCWGQVLERSNLMISKSLDTFHNFIIFIVFVDLHWYNIGTYYVLSECVSVSEVICQYISIAKRIQNLCKQNRQYDTSI